MKQFLMYLWLVMLLLAGVDTSAQEAKSYIKEGNKSFSENEFKKAAELYQKSIASDPQMLEGVFNLGDALYRQEKYEEASRYFNMAASRAEDKEVKAKAFHNLGNSLVKQKKMKEAAEAYKNSLLLNPKDDETLFNLAYSMRELEKQQQDQEKKQEQEQDQQEQEDKNKDQQQEDKEKEQEKEQEQEKQQEQEKEQQEKEEQQQDEQDQQEQQQQQKKDEVSREDATRMLEALENEEKKVQEKLKKKEVKSSEINIEKDW